MTQVEKLIKIIMPDLLKYLKMKESGELAQKRLDMPPSGGFFYVFIAVEFSGRRKICRKRVPSLTETAFPMSGSSQWP